MMKTGPIGSNKFVSSMSAESYWYSGIWKELNSSTLLVTDSYPKTTTTVYDVLFCYKKPASSRQLHTSPAEFTFFQGSDTENNNKSQETMGYHFHKSHGIAVRKHYNNMTHMLCAGWNHF